jgi:aspartyl-tRNA(Asn)/glutamyl-tRNA(Gln) amidotransferase subunit C
MISKQDVEHIAQLARIKLNDNEVEKFQKELGDVLDYFDILKDVHTANVQPMTHAVLLQNVKRSDQAKEKTKNDGQHLIDMAPNKDKGYVKVKSILH